MNGLITQRATEIFERVRDSFDSDTHKGFPGRAVVKNPPAKTGHGFDPWIRKIPWRRKWQETPVF